MTAAKYRSVPCEIDGHRFPSKKEGNVYIALKLMERSKQISGLTLQPRYPLVVNGLKVSTYIADFVFEDRSGRISVVDSKGFRTEKYKLAKKWFEFCYAPLYILEI